MATHSGILAWKIPWTEEHRGLHSRGLKESDTTEQLHLGTSLGVQWLTVLPLQGTWVQAHGILDPICHMVRPKIKIHLKWITNKVLLYSTGKSAQ